jgi:hypothetical protein
MGTVNQNRYHSPFYKGTLNVAAEAVQGSTTHRAVCQLNSERSAPAYYLHSNAQVMRNWRALTLESLPWYWKTSLLFLIFSNSSTKRWYQTARCAVASAMTATSNIR